MKRRKWVIRALWTRCMVTKTTHAKNLETSPLSDILSVIQRHLKSRSRTANSHIFFSSLFKREFKVSWCIQYHSVTRPGEKQTLFATLTVRTSVWIFPNWTLQQSMSMCTRNCVDELVEWVPVLVACLNAFAECRCSCVCSTSFGVRVLIKWHDWAWHWLTFAFKVSWWIDPTNRLSPKSCYYSTKCCSSSQGVKFTLKSIVFDRS